MPAHDWNQHYASGDVPWDTGEADPHLVDLVERGVTRPGRTLEVGCGTGTNALWLAARSFDVFAVDVARLAIEKAEEKRRAAGANVRFAVLDFLRDDVPGGPFDFVLDRGVLHVFDAASDRARFAARVAGLLAPGGHWLCLAGSTEGPPRDHGPPRRSARDLVEAVEPVLALSLLRASSFDAEAPERALAWVMLARRRDVPAQPSTGSEG